MAEFDGLKIIEQHHQLIPLPASQLPPQFTLTSPSGPFSPHQDAPIPSSDIIAHDTPTRNPRCTTTGHHDQLRVNSRPTSAPNLNRDLESKRKHQSDSNLLNSYNEAQDHNRRSVKHLTCFWWKEKGFCRHSDDDCLYAHFDTGRYTDPPRQILPGEPAKAGRSLERALKNLAGRTGSASYEGLTASRPGTPLLDRCGTPQSTPSIHHLQARTPIAPAYNDASFLRSIVENGLREKAALSIAVESLKSDKHVLETGIHRLRAENDGLVQENRNLSQEIESLRAMLGDYHRNNVAVQNAITSAPAQHPQAMQQSVQPPIQPPTIHQPPTQPAHAHPFGRTSTRPPSTQSGFSSNYHGTNPGYASSNTSFMDVNNTSFTENKNGSAHTGYAQGQNNGSLGDNFFEEDHIKRILHGLGSDF